MRRGINWSLCTSGILIASAIVYSGPADALHADDVPARPDGPPTTSLIDRLEQPDDPYLPRRRPTGGGGSPGAVVIRGPFVSIQVNTDAEGNNIIGDAANEPSIAVNPLNPDEIAIGWRQFDTIASNFRQAGIAYSTDGGQTWPTATVLDPGVFRTDPVLDYDHNGHFYYNSLFGLALDTCDVFKSLDGGVNWQEPVPAHGGDKNWMVVDHSTAIGQGHIYSIWREPFSCCGPNIFTRSTDGGASFMFPVPIPQSPGLGTISVGPGSEVYVAGVRESNLSAFRVAKSTNAGDAGATPSFDFVASVFMGGSLRFFAGGPNPDGLLGQVWVATDHSAGPTHGNVYVLCSVDPSGSDPLDVKIVRSVDGAASWSAPVRINDDPVGTNAYQWFGTLSVAPNGRLDVVWNDTRTNNQTNLSELYYAYSTDAGASWSINTPVSPVFDSFVGWPSQNKLGDYYHMISDLAGADLAYAATFNGEQDVYFLRLGDCNGNGIHDGEELADGSAFDVNGNAVLDECECLADLDGSGDVGPADLAMLLATWGPCPGCPADLNGDDTVGPFDLAQLLTAWGPC